MQTADFYSSATGTLRVNGGQDANAPKGVSLSVDDLAYIKQGSRANDAEPVTDYDLLDNKPQINNVTLTGNKSLNDLGIQPKIDSTHKVSSDNIDDSTATNKFATAAQLEQISTNETNITLLMPTAYIAPTIAYTTKMELIYGGYVIIGNICVINMRFSVTDTITKGNNIITGLPKCANMGSLGTGSSFSSLNANNVTAGTIPQLVITKFNNTQCAISIAVAGTDLTTGTHLVSGIYLIDNV